MKVEQVVSQSYALKFEGYWSEEIIKNIPNKSGVYCAYACNNNPETVRIRSLIYIGEAANVNDRIVKHEKWPKWRKHLKKGEEICFNFASVQSTDRDRVEAALVFQHKPPENTDYVDTFPFDETELTTSDHNKLLTARFTVRRTPSNPT